MAITDPRGRDQSREWVLDQLDDPSAHNLSDEELSNRLKKEFDADPGYWTDDGDLKESRRQDRSE